MAKNDMYSAIKQGTVADQTVICLTDLILSDRLKPGEFLPPEPELCRQLNVSRTTVREAVRTMEARGLLQRRHGVGVLVADRTYESAVASIGLMLQRSGSRTWDLLEVRLGLECQAAALAADRATSAEVQAMSDAIETMRRQGSTEEEYLEADLGFHLRLAEGSHNAVLMALLHAVRHLLGESIRATFVLDGRTDSRLADHIRVLDAVREKAPDAARAAMRDHLKNTEEMLRQLGQSEGRHHAPRE
jgi:GntR family transcriptional repressor for pyruvate dehydrogenase complex